MQKREGLHVLVGVLPLRSRAACAGSQRHQHKDTREAHCAELEASNSKAWHRECLRWRVDYSGGEQTTGLSNGCRAGNGLRDFQRKFYLLSGGRKLFLIPHSAPWRQLLVLLVPYAAVARKRAEEIYNATFSMHASYAMHTFVQS